VSQNSAIEWTEATWNPVRGCVKVSPGCAHCYAETFAERFRGVKGHPYEQGFDLRLVPEKLGEPLRRKKPTTYFVNSMSDLFQDGVPDEYIDQVFAVMDLAGQHTFQILTKRAERMFDYCSARHGVDLVSPLPNVWLGVSVENQQFLSRIDALKDTPAAVRFVSFEPLLEDLGAVLLDGIQWAIIGGESGAKARGFDLEWARDLVAQCQKQGVSVFMKQAGAQPYDSSLTASGRSEVLHYHSKKGGDMAEWPADLRIREIPPEVSR